jgi:hypothetical protein
VYKPVEEVDLGPTSHELYLRAHVKGSTFFFFSHRILNFLPLIFFFFFFFVTEFLPLIFRVMYLACSSIYKNKVS